MNPTLLASVSAAVGILVGGVGMWRTLKSDIEQDVEKEVTERVLTATKITRLEERIKAIDARLERETSKP
jgi:ABC-type phosphate/phosphonate transport system substrate-binding protein